MHCVFFLFFSCEGAHRGIAVEQQLSTSSEQLYTITSVPMQSAILPCKAVLPHTEPERVKNRKECLNSRMKYIMYFFLNVGYVV